MIEKSIRDRLVGHGVALFRAPRQVIQFSPVSKADALLNDLARHPRAFVLACVMDRQIKAESADIYGHRIFSRLGLCAADVTVEQVIFKAKALHPEFPGMMDLPCWEIGRNWCKSRGPEGDECYMPDLCPTTKRKT